MKRIALKSTFVFALILIVFNACVKDTGKKQYQVYTPILETTANLRAKVKSETPRTIENAGKIVTIGNYILLNERGKGIHIINNSIPSNPNRISFINIPGNYDMAIKGNTLYADCYTDLLTIDISDPHNIIVKNYTEDLFKDVRTVNGFTCDAGNVITGFKVEEQTMELTVSPGQGIWKDGNYISNGGIWTIGAGGGGVLSSSGSGNVSIGKAGSMSRFALISNYLYTVTTSTLNTLNISNINNPIVANTKNIGWNIETIYPFKDKLFIGSQTGMFIYDLSNAASPSYVSNFAHARLCDPVITDGNYAYITLHSSEDVCAGTQNEINVVDVSDINTPTLLTRMNLTKPHGLDKDGDLIFVCDDNDGIKVIDASNPQNLSLKTTLPLQATYDIICNNGLAIVSTKTGIHQYNYSNPTNITKLSSFNY